MKPKIKTYLKYLQSGYIKTKTDLVIDIIRKNPRITIHDIRTQYKISHQTLTGIISNLMDDGLIYFCGEVKHGSSHFSMLMFEPDVESQKVRAQLRAVEKFRIWANQLSNYKMVLTSEKYKEIKASLMGINLIIL